MTLHFLWNCTVTHRAMALVQYFNTYYPTSNGGRSPSCQERFPKWFGNLSTKILWRNKTSAKNSSVPSLIGKYATCVSMMLLELDQENHKVLRLPILLLNYLNADSDPQQFFLKVDLLSSNKTRANDTLKFTFQHGTDLYLRGRTVEYKLNYTDYTSCSILLKTSPKEEGCSYWVLYTGNDTKVPEWCKPKHKEADCDVEVHTLLKPTECRSPENNRKLRDGVSTPTTSE
uniref:Putative secreted protein n=1 Tax=Ixodes ricinus TaxID=34613 RepID=A0A0K8R8G3_IXORI